MTNKKAKKRLEQFTDQMKIAKRVLASWINDWS